MYKIKNEIFEIEVKRYMVVDKEKEEGVWLLY